MKTMEKEKVIYERTQDNVAKISEDIKVTSENSTKSKSTLKKEVKNSNCISNRLNRKD